MTEYDDKPLEEWEYPDEEDTDSVDLLSDVAPCPECGEHIYEVADRCPYCHVFLPDNWALRQPSDKAYVRFGLWGTKTLLMNWLFWLALSVLGILLWLLRG